MLQGFDKAWIKPCKAKYLKVGILYPTYQIVLTPLCAKAFAVLNTLF